MNLRTLLMMPWSASYRLMRWIAVLVFVAALLGAAGILLFNPGPRGQVLAIGVYAMAIGYLGAFFFSATTLLAIDARQLRLPSAERSAGLALLLYAALVVAIPVVVMALLGGFIGLAASCAAGGFVLGLAFSLLPGYVGMALGFTPALLGAVGHLLHFPVWTPTRLVIAACVALGLGTVTVLIQWPRLVRGHTRDEPGMGGCMVLQLRHGGMYRWGRSGADANRAIRQRPDWTRPEVDVSGTGPRHPVDTLRVALGGWYVPQTLRGRIRKIRNYGAILLFALAFMAIARLDHPGRSLDLATALFALSGFAGTLVVMATIGTPLITATAIHHRWAGTGGELALLALLPGLAPGEARHKHLLRAILTRPLAVHGLALVASLLGAAILHLGLLSTSLLLLSQLCAALATVSAVLGTLGDCEPGPWLTVLLVIAFTTLVSITGFVAVISHRWVDEGQWPYASTVETAFAAGFALLGVTLVWLARRGWRKMRGRPHPLFPVTTR